MAQETDFKQKLWKAADSLRGQMDAAEYKHIVLGLIFLKYISDSFMQQKARIKELVTDPKSDFFISENLSDIHEKEFEDRDYYTQDNIFWVPESARWETLRAQGKQSDIGVIIDLAMRDIEIENKSLKGKLDKRFGRTELPPGKLGKLIDEISTIGFTDNTKAGDLLGEVYEYFLGQFASAEGKKGGEFYTPSCVVRTLVSLLKPTSGRVYDPCCGSGGMFVHSEDFIKAHGGHVDDISIYGQESNPTTWRLAAMNMAIRGLGADLGKTNNDTFAHDNFPDLKFDFILSNPPFNLSEWEGEKYVDDNRWQFGIPPAGNANYAWLQHIFSKLNNEGHAAVILGNGSLIAKDSEGKIKKAMIDEDIVSAVISLPGQLFFNTPTPVSIWVLSKSKKFKVDRRNQILFIDARKLGRMESKKLRVLDEEDIQKISSKYDEWKNSIDYKNEKGFCKSVSLQIVSERDFILTPIRYIDFLGKKSTKEIDSEINLLLKSLESLTKNNQKLRNHIDNEL
jgi:type I restriction enzyme M protein